MIDQQVITGCPVVKSTLGQIVLPPEAIATIGGLLQTQKGLEWAALGWGSVEDDGLTVRVERLTFPAQDRSAGEVVIAEHDQDADLVCVIHSHHSMGAWFSQTDIRELNPLYRASIVVADLKSDRKASRTHSQPDEGMPSLEDYCNNLGFSYQAVMRVRLACGSVGEVEALVGVDDPGSTLADIFNFRPGWSNVGAPLPTSEPCPKTREVASPSKLLEVRQAECDEGLQWVSPRLAVWGTAPERTPELLRAVTEGSGRRHISPRSELPPARTRSRSDSEDLRDDWARYQEAEQFHRSGAVLYPRTASERSEIEKKLIARLTRDLSSQHPAAAADSLFYDRDTTRVMAWFGLKHLRTHVRNSYTIDSVMRELEDWDAFELIAEVGLYEF